MNAFQMALMNISGNAFRNGVVSLCALLISAFALFTTLVMRGAETSLRLTIDRLGADIVVVPEGSEANIESALLMGVPARFWMPKNNLDRIASIPGVETASPQLYLVTLKDAPCCSVSDMFMIAYDPATDFTIEPWLKQELGDELHLGEVVGGAYITATEGEDKIKVYGYLTTLKTNLEPTGTGLDQSIFLTFDTAYDIAEKSVTQAVKPLDIPPDSISAALIKVTPGTDPHDVAVRIAQKIPGVTPIESSTIFQSYRKHMTSLLKSIMVILSVTWGLSVVLIGLVFSMAANEPRKELGATRRFLFQSLLAEASLLALVGGVTGLALAGMAIFLFRNLIMASLDIPFLLPSLVSLLLQDGGVLILALFSVNLAALFPAIKISRDALELERNKLRRILDTMPNGIYIVTQQYEIEYVNPVMEREFGPMDGSKCYSYFQGRTEPCPWCKNEQVFNGQNVRWELYSQKSNKTYDLFDTPLINSDGSISKLVLFHDITQRKKAEQELEQRNLELQILSATEHKQRQLAETLRASAQELAQSLDLNAVFRTLLKHVRLLVPCDIAGVALLEGESLLFVRAGERYEKWIEPDALSPFEMDVENNPFYQKLIATRKSLLISDTAEEPAWEVYPGFEQIHNLLVAPIMVEEKIVGVVALGKAEANFFTEEHVQWAEALVGQAVVVIQNAWLFEQVRAGRERLQSLSRRLVELQEVERRFIARELHDHAGQMLTSLMLGLGALEMETDEPQNVRMQVDELKVMTNTLLEDLHHLAINLRPASLDQLGLVPALDQLIKVLSQNSPPQIRFMAEGIGEDDRMTQDVETTLYRITQEALTNVIRHAEAQHVDVVLERRDDVVFILVEDDGRGFDAEQAKKGEHLGLIGMEERAEMLGGMLTVESVPGIGTTLVAEVPYANSNHAGG